MIFLFGAWLLALGVCARDISSSLTSSKFEEPACNEDVITFTCAIYGTTLMWALNGTTMKTYNADDACGMFEPTSYASFNLSFVLASSVQDGDGLLECTSIMTMSSSLSTTVEVDCSTMNTTTGEAEIKTDSYQLRFLGFSTPAIPLNFTAVEIASSQLEPEAKLYNLSWVPTNDIEIIEMYRVVIVDDGIIVDNTTVLHPDTTSTLISVSDEIENLEFFLETIDKCDEMSLSDAASIFNLPSAMTTTVAATAIECVTTATSAPLSPQQLLIGMLSAIGLCIQ